MSARHEHYVLEISDYVTSYAFHIATHGRGGVMRFHEHRNMAITGRALERYDFEAMTLTVLFDDALNETSRDDVVDVPPNMCIGAVRREKHLLRGIVTLPSNSLALVIPVLTGDDRKGFLQMTVRRERRTRYVTGLHFDSDLSNW